MYMLLIKKEARRFNKNMHKHTTIRTNETTKYISPKVVKEWMSMNEWVWMNEYEMLIMRPEVNTVRMLVDMDM